jgi:TonB-dependent receptor
MSNHRDRTVAVSARAPRASARGRSWTRAAARLSTTSLLALGHGAQAADAPADGAATQVAGVVITAAPRQEVKAREVQLFAPNLISVQSAETIAKYPDFNAAEALGRMPGISISTDTGEGRFVNIRGIDGNLDGATFGSVPLLNTYPGGTYFSGGGRAVEFDTVPTGAIDGLIVTYTGLPDHEAEGLGGSVELTPRTATNVSEPFADLTLGGGYEPEHQHAGPWNAEIAVGGRFGFDGENPVFVGVGEPLAPRVGFFSDPTPFSFVLTASRREDRRGFDDIEEDYNNPGTGDRSYQDLQLRKYDYHRIRTGAGAEFDFTPNEDHHYYIRANAAGYTESVIKNRLTYDFSNDDGAPGDYPAQVQVGSGYTGAADLTEKSTDEKERHDNDVFVAGGEDRFGRIVLDYRTSYTLASYDQLRDYGTTWNGPTDVAVAYNNSGKNGDFPSIAITDGTNPNNASLYTLKKGAVGNQQEHDHDSEYTYAANLLFPVHLLNDDDRIKTGFEVRLRSKDQNVYADSTKIGSLNLAGFSGPADTDFYQNGYTNGPEIDDLAIRALVQQKEGPLVWDPSQYFNARENIYAEYAQYQAKVGAFGLMAGARVETTNATYGNYTFDGDGNETGFLSNPKNYTNVFPTVQLRYEITPTMLVRATYSTGIARPGFNQVAGAVTVDTSNGIITTGNPNLNPTLGSNFDLDFEYYLPHGGILELGLFDKEFTDYIVTQVRYGTDARVPGDPAVQFVTFGNTGSAYARGIQAAYHQKFDFLPKPLEGLGVESNVTLVDSHFQEYDANTSATGHAEYGNLPGTSKVTANIAGFYEAHGIEARLSGEYVGPELFSLGGSKAADTIQDKRFTLDFGSSYTFDKTWKIYFNAKNLTNEPLRFYLGNPSFPIQREFYDVTYEAGVKAHF